MSTSTGTPPGSSGAEADGSGGSWCTGAGQSRQAVYASVYWFTWTHSVAVNGAKVPAGSAASAAASCARRSAGVAVMSNSCG